MIKVYGYVVKFYYWGNLELDNDERGGVYYSDIFETKQEAEDQSIAIVERYINFVGVKTEITNKTQVQKFINRSNIEEISVVPVVEFVKGEFMEIEKRR